jgi:hypothetical protein
MLKDGICSVIFMGARRNGEKDQLSFQVSLVYTDGSGVVAWINSLIFRYSAGP